MLDDISKYNSEQKYHMSTVPKGYCHNKNANAKSKQTLEGIQGTHQAKSIRKYSQQRMSQIDGFYNFDEYLQHIREKEKMQKLDALVRSKTISPKNTLRLKPNLPMFLKQSKIVREDKRQQDLAMPYTPFYKCQIKYNKSHNQGGFRIKHRSFRVNRTIMEQNMGRGDRGGLEPICYT